MYDRGFLDRASRLAHALRDAERRVRILRSLAWPRSVREGFLAARGERPPTVGYGPFDSSEVERIVDRVRAELDASDPVDAWLERCGVSIANGARLIAARGTPRFADISVELYGRPTSLLVDGRTTSLEFARSVDRMLDHVAHVDLGAPDPACHLAVGVAARIRTAVQATFGAAAPLVEVVEDLSSNALAGPSRIRLRRTACFRDRDVDQLIHHEAYVHVATALNGRAQRDFPLLAAGHAGTTRTQEGLAVFAEFVSGTMEPDRLRRLADRVLAIQMALDGADFVEVFRWFLERTGSDEQAFENARRVFRGGVTTGGAPFTKDGVYFDGLLRVANYLRAAVDLGRADCIVLLFAGKLDLADVPVLARLAASGALVEPRFLAPWIVDRRFLVSYLMYSSFLDRVDLGEIRSAVGRELEHAPRLGATVGWLQDGAGRTG